MRYPEDKIKEAILHPDPEIRDRATGYFAKSFSPDPTIMPLVIKAVETYGRQRRLPADRACPGNCGRPRTPSPGSLTN